METSTNFLSAKTITFSLSKFLDIILSHHDWIISPDEETALLIALIDKEESLCHIEFSGDLNLLTINSIGARPEDTFDGAHLQPIIWRKNAWINSQPKFILAKKQAEDRNAARNLKNDRVNKLIKAMIETTGVDDRKLWESKAITLVEKQQWTKIEMVWGIKL